MKSLLFGWAGLSLFLTLPVYADGIPLNYHQTVRPQDIQVSIQNHSAGMNEVWAVILKVGGKEIGTWNRSEAGAFSSLFDLNRMILTAMEKRSNVTLDGSKFNAEQLASWFQNGEPARESTEEESFVVRGNRLSFRAIPNQDYDILLQLDGYPIARWSPLSETGAKNYIAEGRAAVLNKTVRFKLPRLISGFGLTETPKSLIRPD